MSRGGAPICFGMAFTGRAAAEACCHDCNYISPCTTRAYLKGRNPMLDTDKDGHFVGKWEPSPGLRYFLFGHYRRMRLEQGGWEYATAQEVATEALRQQCAPVPHTGSLRARNIWPAGGAGGPAA